MAAALIIEDGTGVDNANSYVDRETVVDYCALRGLTVADIPQSGNDPLLPFIVNACDYLQLFNNRYIGRQQYPDGLAWPRLAFTCGYSSQRDVPYFDGVIPTMIKKAQCQLVVEQLKGNSIFSSAGAAGASVSLASPLADADGNTIDIAAADSRFVTRERLEGVADIQYSETVGISLTAFLPQVDSMLANLLTSGYNGFQMNVSRG
jgi:hypothetical protein